MVKDNEVGALITGLEGRYIEPGPGGDPIRNPGVLPTGKNIHALDPQSIPTQVCLCIRVRVCVTLFTTLVCCPPARTSTLWTPSPSPRRCVHACVRACVRLLCTCRCCEKINNQGN